jgi:hypothetical protein
MPLKSWRRRHAAPRGLLDRRVCAMRMDDASHADGTADRVLTQMHMTNATGMPAHNNSVKTMQKTGTAHPEPNAGGCCVLS